MGVVPWGQTDVCSGGDRCHHRGRAIATAPGDIEDDVTAIVNGATGEPTSEQLINSLWVVPTWCFLLPYLSAPNPLSEPHSARRHRDGELCDDPIDGDRVGESGSTSGGFDGRRLFATVDDLFGTGAQEEACYGTNRTEPMRSSTTRCPRRLACR